MTTHGYLTSKQLREIDQGILDALEGEKWLNVKQIGRKMAATGIHATGQCISQRCRSLEEDRKIMRTDYNSVNSRNSWKLVE